MTKEQIEKIDEVCCDINLCVGALTHLEGKEMIKKVRARLVHASLELKMLTGEAKAAIRKGLAL